MLDSNSRRDNFDAFFASLDTDFQCVFMDAVTNQYHDLRNDGRVSIIDCMENVWDHWQELRHTNPSWFGPLDIERSIMAHMLDPNREQRARGIIVISNR